MLLIPPPATFITRLREIIAGDDSVLPTVSWEVVVNSAVEKVIAQTQWDSTASEGSDRAEVVVVVVPLPGALHI